MKKCPNSYDNSKSETLGYYNNNGVLVYSETDDNLVLENNLRFSSNCETTNCKNWSGRKCIIPPIILSNIKEFPNSNSNYLKCTIKKECRWFYQEGIQICEICPVIK